MLHSTADEIVKVIYNWRICPIKGEMYDYAEVGANGVKFITYASDNNQHYCDIWREDGLGGWLERVFNINKIIIKLPL